MLLGLERQEREPRAVLVVALPRAEREQEEGADHEGQAHEHLQDDHRHAAPLPSAMAVATTMVIELVGISTAQRTGDMTPAYASATASTL